jgi:anti-sigma regulatory factor (Ser/Thr protein kinase)
MVRSYAVPIVESSQVAAARRAALGLASQIGLSDRAIANLGLAVSEAATNLVKHATGGVCVFRPLSGAPATAGQAERRGVEVLCLDRGPGIANVTASMRDGFSTTGTLGGGLGAMKRLSQVFDLHSRPGSGTAIVFEIWDAEDAPTERARARLVLGAISIPKRGEEVCGDSWALRASESGCDFLVVDGIGHGLAAATAANAAVDSFDLEVGASADRSISRLDRALRGTRGAAAAVTSVDYTRRSLAYCGVGNTAAALLRPREGDEESRVEHLVSQPGTLGHSPRHIRAFEYGWDETATLVLHTDGISTRWDLDGYPGLLARHPTLIAGVLWRDWSRGEDDATVVVARWRR